MFISQKRNRSRTAASSVDMDEEQLQQVKQEEWK